MCVVCVYIWYNMIGKNMRTKFQILNILYVIGCVMQRQTRKNNVFS